MQQPMVQLAAPRQPKSAAGRATLPPQNSRTRLVTSSPSSRHRSNGELRHLGSSRSAEDSASSCAPQDSRSTLYCRSSQGFQPQISIFFTRVEPIKSFASISHSERHSLPPRLGDVPRCIHQSSHHDPDSSQFGCDPLHRQVAPRSSKMDRCPPRVALQLPITPTSPPNM